MVGLHDAFGEWVEVFRSLLMNLTNEAVSE